MSNEVKESKFVYPYGPKKMGYNAFNPEMDTTDQRAPINDVQELYNQFLVDGLMDELDAERIEDFDDDFYDYDDRSEYGVDVAASADAEIAAEAARLKSRKKSNGMSSQRSGDN